MEHSRRFTKDLIDAMNRFQKKNNTKNKCVTNSLYLYDSLRFSFPLYSVKVKPVIVIINDEEGFVTEFNMGHVVVLCNNDILDPSYQINQHKNIRYYETIQGFISSLPSGDNTIRQRMREIIDNFLKMVKLVERINDGEGLITEDDKDYYNRQANYVEELLHSKNPYRSHR